MEGSPSACPACVLSTDRAGWSVAQLGMRRAVAQVRSFQPALLDPDLGRTPVSLPTASVPRHCSHCRVSPNMVVPSLARHEIGHEQQHHLSEVSEAWATGVHMLVRMGPRGAHRGSSAARRGRKDDRNESKYGSDCRPGRRDPRSTHRRYAH